MNPNRIQQLTLVFIGGTLLACLFSGRWLLNGEMNIFNALSSFNTVQLQASGLISFPKGLITFFNAVVTALAWRYPFLMSPWAFPIVFIGWISSVGAVVELIQAAQYTISSIVSWFKP